MVYLSQYSNLKKVPPKPQTLSSTVTLLIVLLGVTGVASTDLLNNHKLRVLFLPRSNISGGSVTVLGIMGLITFGLVCQGSSQKPPEIPMPQAPQVTVTAVVVSTTLGYEKTHSKEKPNYQYPNDEGVILIRHVSDIDNPDDITIEGYHEGGKVKVDFKYSARPAIVVKIPAPSNSTFSENQETTASGKPRTSEPIQREKGFFVFKNESASVGRFEVIVLPGLAVGYRIETNVTYSGASRGSVSMYEVINSNGLHEP